MMTLYHHLSYYVVRADSYWKNMALLCIGVNFMKCTMGYMTTM
jgi:hypothetical protein